MQENVQKAIDGEITPDELEDSELKEYRDEAKRQAEEAKKEVSGLRSARQAEESKLEEAQRQAQEKEESKKGNEEDEQEGSGEDDQGDGQKQDQGMTQFRQEQVQKAKDKLKKDVELTDEQYQALEEKFDRLDTGKMDADYIYEDLKDALAASNSEKFIELTRESEEMKKGAEEHTQQDAGSNGVPSSNSGEDTGYSQEVKDYAQQAGITEEAAQRQLNSGTTRRL